MKNIILVLALGLLLLVSTSSTIYASCPSGYTSYTMTATYVYVPIVGATFNCPITVKYCCKWDNTLKQVVTIIDEFYGTSTNCPDAIPNWSHFIDWLHNVVALSSHSSCAPTFPPCDDQTTPFYETKVTSSRCWKIENKLVHTGEEYAHHYINCQTSDVCVSTWRVCIDYSVSPPVVVRTFISKVSIGTPQCSTEDPIIPPVGKTEDEYWITDCFTYPC